MQQHAVPQNISSFEFKLIGELTLKQFAFLGSGIIIAYLIYISILPPFFKWPLVVLFGIGGAAFALIPIEERPLHQWFISFFRAIFSPTQRIWRKHPQLPDFLLPAHQLVNRITSYQPSGQTRFQLEQYLAKLPTTKSQLDVQEEKFIQTLPWDMTPAALPIQPQTPIESGQIMPTQTPPAPFYQPSPGIEQAGIIAIAPTQPTPTLPTQKPEPIFEIPGLATRPQPEAITPPITIPVATPKKEQVLPIASEINFGTQPIIAIHMPDAQTRFIPGIGQIRVRKLHSTEPLAEVSLPIRGEKRFEISAAFQRRLAPTKSGLEPTMSNDRTADQSAAFKPTAFVKTVSAPVAPVSPQLNVPPPQPNPVTPPENTNVSETTKKISQLNQDNQRLIRQIQDINQQLADAKDKGDDTYVSSLRTALNQARQEKEAATNQTAQLQAMLMRAATQSGQAVYIPRGRGRTPNIIKQVTQPYATTIPSTPQRPKIPNIISGLVQDANGSSLENVIIVIYDENKTPVRAFRTNKLGQFTISTPLTNGNYAVEFEKEGYNFDILNLQMNGNIVEPITVRAKA